MSSIRKLVEEARDLPDDQKPTLADRVLQLTEQAMTGYVDDEWDPELRARIQAYDEGRSQTKSALDVFRNHSVKERSWRHG